MIAPIRLPGISVRLLFQMLAGLVRHVYLDRPRPRLLSVGPNASLKTWLAAAPAMMIMEPMATYCRIIAMRSLLQLFDIIWA
jgi:hypothetical protein